MALPRSLAPIVLTACAACATSPHRPPPPVVVPSTQPTVGESKSKDRAIVWVGDDEGEGRSFWIEPTLSGHRVTDEAPGIFIASRGSTWAWKTEKVDVPTQACDPDNGPGDAPAGTGVGTRGVFEEVGTADRHVVVEPAPDDGANELDHRVVLLASAGPFAFIQESSYVYACGAHGFTSAALKVWDLTRSEAVVMSGPSAQGQPTDDLLRQARDAFGEDDGETGSNEAVDWVAIVPRYEASARLAVDFVFTTWACYACGDGAWGSYSRHAAIPGPVPKQLEPYVEAPDVVQSFVEANPNLQLRGWSLTTESKR